MLSQLNSKWSGNILVRTGRATNATVTEKKYIGSYYTYISIYDIVLYITDTKEEKRVVKAELFEFLLRLFSVLETVLTEEGGRRHHYG